MVKLFSCLVSAIVLMGSCGGPLVPSQMTSEVLLGDYTNYAPKYIADCVLWLDGNDPSGTGRKPPSNSRLPTWIDKSGLNNNLTQSVLANQPYYFDKQLNGHGGFKFVANSGFVTLSYPSGWIWGTTAQRSVYIVFKMQTMSDLELFGHNTGGQSATDLTFGRYAVAGSNFLTIDSGNFGNTVSIGTSTVFVGRPYMVSYRNDSVNILSAKAFLSNNVAPMINNSYPNGYTPTLFQGTLFVGSTGRPYYQFDIFEIIVFMRKLSDAEDSRVRAYLSQKWGI